MRGEPAYLTFDDGPDPVATPRVLDALASAGVRATFFVLGSRVLTSPGLLEAMLSAGHCVELHAHDHVSHEEMSRAETERDLERGLEVLERVGVRPTRWRPPYGGVTSASFTVAESHGLELTAWTTNPCDWASTPAGTMLAAVDRMLGAHAVVVLHDGVMADEGMRTDADQTVALVESLVAELRARGCEPVPLPPGGEGGAPLAVAGFAPAPWSRRFAEFRVVEETEVGPKLRERLGDFIADVYEDSGAPYRGRAWRTIPPAARIVALAGGELIGHASVFLPRTRPTRRIAGIGDLAVARSWRRRGVAQTLLRHAVFQGWRRGARAQLAATEAVRTTLAELGFETVDGFAFYWGDGAACRRDPLWMAAAAEPLPRPLRLLDPDF